MGKSLRSKTKLKYRNELRSKVFEPEEDARRRRLAEKLMGNVKQAAKDEKKAGNKGKDSKDTDKDGEAMDEDEEDEENKDKEITDKDGEKQDTESKSSEKKASTSSWKKKAKKQRSFRRKR